MTTPLSARSQQRARSVSASDTNDSPLYSNRGGQLEVNTIQGMYDSWLRAGKVFQATGDTFGATSTIENNTAIDLTEPFFRLSVPASRTIVPIMFKAAPAVVWETGDEVAMFIGDTATYNTGGDVCLVKNMTVFNAGSQTLRETLATNVRDGDAALTEDTLTNPRLIDVHHFITGGLHLPYEYNILKGNPWSYITGPATWGVMIARTTTTVEVLYTAMWAELDKEELSNT